MARSLSHDFKFAVRTAPELYDAISALTSHAGSRGLKFRGRKVGVEAVVNAILTEFLARPEADRLATLTRGVAAFEALMEADTVNETSPAPYMTEAGPIPTETTTTIIRRKDSPAPSRRKGAG